MTTDPVIAAKLLTRLAERPANTLVDGPTRHEPRDGQIYRWG